MKYRRYKTMPTYTGYRILDVWEPILHTDQNLTDEQSLKISLLVEKLLNQEWIKDKIKQERDKENE
jgi:hypothetical protein